MNRRTFLTGLMATATGVLVPASVLAEPERRIWALDRTMLARNPEIILLNQAWREIDMVSETVMAQIHRDYWDGDKWTDFPVTGTLHVLDPRGDEVFAGNAGWDGAWHVRHNWNASAIIVYDDATGKVISHHQWGTSL